MKKVIVVLFFAVALLLYVTAGLSKETENGKSGEKMFRQYCSVCHPDGGNIINAQKTLHKKDLDANNIKNAGDIVSKMRHPGPGMTQFDENTVSEKDAKKIAEYILENFK